MNAPLRPFVLRVFGCVGLLAGASSLLSAQPVVAASNVASAAKPAGETSAISLSNISSALALGTPLFQRGPVAIRPHAEYRFLYGDGIEAGPGNPRSTAIHTVSVGTLVELGHHWQLDYSPAWTYYSNEAFRDTFDQTVGLSADYRIDRWRFTGAEGYESLHAMLVETGHQTKQEKHTTSLSAAYAAGRHVRLEISGTRSARDANAVDRAPEWTTSDWLEYSTTGWVRYQVSPRLNFAAGATFGSADVSAGEDMRFSEPKAQVSWKVTDKITLSGQAGTESRTFKNSARGKLHSPTHSASLGYQPFQTTRLSVQANRSISASYFANEITRGDGWMARIEQRFLQRLYVDAGYSEHTTHFLSTQIANERRSDRYRALNVRLSTVFLGRTAFSLVFQTGRNTSDAFGYEFVSHQYGCELSHRF